MQRLCLELEYWHRHRRQVVLPDDDQVTTREVVSMSQKVGSAKLRLGEDAITLVLQQIVGKRGSALDNAVSKAIRTLGEDLSNIQLASRHERHLFHRVGF